MVIPARPFVYEPGQHVSFQTTPDVYNIGVATQCIDCPRGQFQAAMGHRSEVCADTSVCPVGRRITAAPTLSTDTRCASDNACRQWEMLGSQGTCEPAMWLDFHKCVNGNRTQVKAGLNALEEMVGLEQMDWTTRPLDALRNHRPERISVMRRTGGACTALPVLGTAMRDMIERSSALLFKRLDITGRNSLDLFAGHNVQNMMSVRVTYADDGAIGQHGGGAISQHGDRFTLELFAGSDCTTQVTIEAAAGDVPVQFVTHGLSLAAIKAGGTYTHAANASGSRSAGQGRAPAAAVPADPVCSGIELRIVALAAPELGATGYLPGEPRFSLGWTTPSEPLVASAPAMACPPHINLRMHDNKFVLFVKLSTESVAGPDGMYAHTALIWSGVDIQGEPIDKPVGSITASDRYNITHVGILPGGSGSGSAPPHGRGSSSGGGGGGGSAIKLDCPYGCRKNVTFRASNFMGLTQECTVEVSTFTTSTAWNPTVMDMKSEVPEGQARDAGDGVESVYYAGSAIKVPGPYTYGFGTDGKHGPLFERSAVTMAANHEPESVAVSFRVEVTPANRNKTFICVNMRSGDLVIQPTDAGGGGSTPEGDLGRYQATLYGVDYAQGGAETIVNTWRFAVKARPKFRVYEYARFPKLRAADAAAAATSAPTDPQCGPPVDVHAVIVNVSEFARTGIMCSNEPFTFAPVTLVNYTDATGALQSNYVGTRDMYAANPITYGVRGDVPDGLFIHPRSGAVQGIVAAAGNYSIQFYAMSYESAPLEAVTLRFKPRDTTVAMYGPAGTGCVHGKAFDDVEFDANFTCICDLAYTGDNCNTATVLRSGASDEEDADAEEAQAILVHVVIAILVLLVCSLVGVFATRARREYTAKYAPADFEAHIKQLQEAEDPITTSGDTVLAVPREITRAWLTLVEKIGRGNFGDVWKGLLDDRDYSSVPEYIVAAKTVRNKVPLQASLGPYSDAVAAAREELMQEAMVMAQVAHPNLVALIGVVTKGDPWVLIVSYCEHGSLLAALKDRAVTGNRFDDLAKLNMCHETALGMAHLTKCHIIHRDLAARNILLASGYTCKVADFGLSRYANAGTDTEYYKSHKGIFPVKWTAPEAMEGKYTAASDVWSFGITAVEIFNDALEPPYSGMTHPEVITCVQSGKKHSRPTRCPRSVYTMMLGCWRQDPLARPSFVQLAATCATLLTPQHDATAPHHDATAPATSRDGDDHGMPHGNQGQAGNEGHDGDDYDMPHGAANMALIRAAANHTQVCAEQEGGLDGGLQGGYSTFNDPVQACHRTVNQGRGTAVSRAPRQQGSSSDANLLSLETDAHIFQIPIAQQPESHADAGSPRHEAGSASPPRPHDENSNAAARRQNAHREDASITTTRKPLDNVSYDLTSSTPRAVSYDLASSTPRAGSADASLAGARRQTQWIEQHGRADEHVYANDVDLNTVADEAPAGQQSGKGLRRGKQGSVYLGFGAGETETETETATTDSTTDSTDTETTTGVGTAADELNQMDTFMQAPVDGCMTANPMFAVAPSTGLDV